MSEWYAEPGTPDPEWWWAVEHRGHPAFYLRALMSGDFAPGRAVLPRHARALDSDELAEGAVSCGTCGEEPRAEDLEPIERTTGLRRVLEEYRSGRRPWRKPTDPASCWQCGDLRRPKQDVHPGRGPEQQRVQVCGQCAAHLARGRS